MILNFLSENLNFLTELLFVSYLKAKFANPDPKYANLETTPNGNPGTAMSEQPKSANSGADKKPELPVISEPKSIDQPDAASTKLNAEVKDKEVQEKDHMLKFVHLKLFFSENLSYIDVFNVYRCFTFHTIYIRVGHAYFGMFLLHRLYRDQLLLTTAFLLDGKTERE